MKGFLAWLGTIQYRAGLRREIRRVKRRRTKLAAELAELTYDSSPPDFPLWYKQEVQRRESGSVELSKRLMMRFVD